MSSNASSHGSDKAAAFAGLIGGALFIAAVVMALVVWTNKRFDAHEGEAAHSARTVPAESVVG